MKKLKLTKQAFKNYFLGKRLVWILANDNFLNLCKKYPSAKKVDLYRYKTLTDKDFKKNEIVNIPETLLDGEETAKKYKIYYQKKYSEFKIIDLSNEKNIQKVQQKTLDLLKNEQNFVLFEGGFEYKDFIVRSDIIVKKDNNIKLIEAKATTSPKKEHMYDVAYQKFIFDKKTIELEDLKWQYRILHLNNNFIYNKKNTYNDQIDNLFLESSFYYNSAPKKDEYNNNQGKELDLLENIKNLFLKYDFDYIFDQIKIIQQLDELPEENILDSYNFFKNDWLPFFQEIEEMNFDDSIYNFRGDTGFSLVKKNKIWYEYKYKTISEVPDDLLVSSSFLKQKLRIPPINDSNRETFLRGNNLLRLIQKDSTILRKPIIYKNEIKKHLKNYKLPIYMFDFEAVKSAIPLVDKTWPYEQIPYQYSVHIITDLDNLDYEKGTGFIHLEHLAENKDNFYETLFKNLVKDLTSKGLGTYVAYNKSFEQMVIKNALNPFKKLPQNIKDKLIEINQNMVDLMIPFSKMYYYNFTFNGSYSIKYVTKEFTSLNYQNLDELVRKGDQSAVQCKKWLLENTEKSEQTWQKIRPIMIEYCMYDTLSMVGIFQKLLKMVN